MNGALGRSPAASTLCTAAVLFAPCLQIRHWAPSVPVVLYHGSPDERRAIRAEKMPVLGRSKKTPESFPIVVTSFEVVMKDRLGLHRPLFNRRAGWTSCELGAWVVSAVGSGMLTEQPADPRLLLATGPRCSSTSGSTSPWTRGIASRTRTAGSSGTWRPCGRATTPRAASS